MTSAGGHCYCGTSEINSLYFFTCDRCKRKFHEECLIHGLPSVLQGDYLFHFKCQACGGGEEEFTRMKLQWMQVVQLTLYNLQLSGTGMRGYFRWKEHICTYIDRHWSTFFGSHRKKTSLWHGTVAGVLSSGCPGIFVSGAHDLKETGWWKLVETKPPTMNKQGTPVSKNVVKKKETPPGPVSGDTPKEGLRSRRGKTSIQAAMELKAKRATLMEAKEIRKTKLAKNQPNETQSATTSAAVSSLLSEHLQSPAVVTRNLTVHTPQQADFIVNKTQTDTSNPLVFTGLFQNSSSSFSEADQQRSSVTGSLLAEHLTSSATSNVANVGNQPLTVALLASQTGSVPDFSDENSNVSQSSYLTEKDLKLPATVPNLLMSDDVNIQDSDSDLEIDPGTMSPPPPGSPIRMQDSPTVQELLSTMDSESSDRLLEDSFLDYSNQGSLSLDASYQGSISMDTSNHGSSSILSNSNQGNFSFFNTSNLENEAEESKITEEQEQESVVDSESESDSDSAMSDSEPELVGEQAEHVQKVKRRRRQKPKETEVETTPDVKYQLMSSYEERLLLKKLEQVSKSCVLPPQANRLKRKLIVRQLKREHSLPQFDLDNELNKLSQRCWDLQYGFKDRQTNISGHHYHGDMRILDKFQTLTYSLTKAQIQQQPSFLNRLVGTEDDQLHSICSPYTARILKPFIRRDYETRTMKMNLLQEIKAYAHRNDPSWQCEPPPPIDYCYVRPQHIPSVNALCREFFWPGIDLSECLQYPDFSCVCLYRKIVIGFAFMVPDPDVKRNEAYISFLFTHPEWRHSGMASFMLYHLIQTCMGKDVTLHVSATNTAMLLYQKFGFKPEEFILDFYDKYYPVDTKECKHAFFLRLRR